MLRKNLCSGVIAVFVLFTAVTQASADSCQPTTGTPSGTVTYNGQTISVTNGAFTLNGITGSIDNGGYVSYNGYTGCLTNIPGVTGYQVSGQQAVALTPVFTGTITYGNDSVAVNNGQFTYNGKTGTVTSSGSSWTIAYDGANANINNVDCLTSYKLDGQLTVQTGKASCVTSAGSDFASWAAANGGVNKNRGANWQEYSDGASQYQVNAWIKYNPTLSPMQVFTSMKASNIKFLTVALAWQGANFGGALHDFNFANPPVTTRMLYDAGLIDIPKYRTTNPISYIFSGDNVRMAAIYGLIPMGVRFADECRIDTSNGTDEAIYFSQQDLNQALSYRANGYWGPYNTGDIQMELQKMGSGAPKAGAFNSTPTGPNIATANDCKLSTQTTTSTTNSTVNSTATTGTTVTTGTTAVATTTLPVCYDCGGNAAPTPVTDSASCLTIPMTLSYQSRDSTTNGYVTLLQSFLHTTNYLLSLPTGFFGSGTYSAVKAFQAANGISSTGSVGPNTRAMIKQVSCALPTTTVDTSVVIPDTGTTSTLPDGCTSTEGYSTTTGTKCSSSSLPAGCTSTVGYSPLTGTKCGV